MRLVLLTLAVSVVSISGQQQPTFKAGVQLIEVDARVFDPAGRFVADLTREDFEVLENGVPQRIDEMYLVTGALAPKEAIADPSTPDLKVGPTRALTPAAPQTWIFVFDLNHLTPGGGFDRARKAVEEFLAQRFKEGDVGGILAGDKMLNNRLSSVRQELVDAVKQIKPRSDARTRFIELTREWPRFLNEEEAIRAGRNERDVVQRVVSRACAEDPDACRMSSVDAMVIDKGRRLQQEMHRSTMLTLGSLNALALGLARIPGPKTVVLLSDGFVSQDIEGTVRSVVGQVTRAGGRVYAIDVRGLNRGPASSNIIDQQVADDSYNSVTKFDTVADAPNSLAVDTGGIMIRNENNIGRALDRVADDAGSYYVLAYQPANTTFDGKYRPIQVKVKREGLRVRARRGYLALEPAKMLKPQPIK